MCRYLTVSPSTARVVAGRKQKRDIGASVQRWVAPCESASPCQMGYKWCADCDAYQPHDAFGRNRASYDGFNSYCRVHHNLRGRTSHLSRSYGLSVKKVRLLSERQADVCAICLRPFEGRPHVDHDHATGEIRGLLCFNCNGGLGQFRDDEWSLRRAAEYLAGTLVAPMMESPGVYAVSGHYQRPGA